MDVNAAESLVQDIQKQKYEEGSNDLAVFIWGVTWAVRKIVWDGD